MPEPENQAFAHFFFFWAAIGMAPVYFCKYAVFEDRGPGYEY